MSKQSEIADAKMIQELKEAALAGMPANPAAILALIAKVERLEKEADWLACKIICASQIGKQCDFGKGCICKDCKENTMSAKWREAARDAIAEREAQDASAENPGNPGK